MKTNKQNRTNAKELANRFPMLQKYGLLKNAASSARKYYSTTERGALAHLAKKEKEIAAAIERGKVKEIHIAIRWTTGGAYGWQAYCAGGYVITANGTIYDLEKKHKTTGCGYDKGSTCAAGVLNDWMLPNLLAARRRYALAKNKKTAPYGVSFTKGYKAYFEGGVGLSSIVSCLQWLGAKVEWSNQEKADFITAKF